MPISLATFKNQEEETEDIEQENPNTSSNPTEDKSKFELHQDIERSILQQFFYRERDDDVQYSRFKKIHNIKKKLSIYCKY
ncbi:MAG: hypothetical protein U9R27_10200 [Campylobacterota bacterium]|nr:hypothetical protein [Campylobacterota bacterium]